MSIANIIGLVNATLQYVNVIIHKWKRSPKAPFVGGADPENSGLAGTLTRPENSG
ncbi:MAG: hypothetical protein WCX31_22425 [Salinivirgaceae bacterium]